MGTEGSVAGLRLKQLPMGMDGKSDLAGAHDLDKNEQDYRSQRNDAYSPTRRATARTPCSLVAVVTSPRLLMGE